MREYNFDWPDKDLEKSVNPAFCFWLFSLNTFGPFQEIGEPQGIGELDHCGICRSIGLHSHCQV
jgi:hypothetical protein